MSKRRRITAFTASFSLLAGACWFITNAIPLVAQPQYVTDAPGVTVNLNGNTLVHRSGVAYSRDLATKGVEGTLQTQLRLDGSGAVVDAVILSGPDELRSAVLRSVLDWHFSRSAANTTRQISVTFEAPKGAARTTTGIARVGVSATPMVRSDALLKVSRDLEPRRISAIETSGLPDDAGRDLIGSLPVHVGDMLTPDMLPKLFYAVREYDEHLSISMLQGSQNEVRLNIHPQAAGPSAPPPPPPPPPPDAPVRQSVPGSVRVGAAVEAANLVSQVSPAYPPLAKQARVQGTVRFDTTIGKDGTVQNLQVISGPPLLIQAAMEAVQQWVYKPTLLNGEPVTVLTTVDVNFTLAP